jgi:hypothetical protein
MYADKIIEKNLVWNLTTKLQWKQNMHTNLYNNTSSQVTESREVSAIIKLN